MLAHTHEIGLGCHSLLEQPPRSVESIGSRRIHHVLELMVSLKAGRVSRQRFGKYAELHDEVERTNAYEFCDEVCSFHVSHPEKLELFARRTMAAPSNARASAQSSHLGKPDAVGVAFPIRERICITYRTSHLNRFGVLILLEYVAEYATCLLA